MVVIQMFLQKNYANFVMLKFGQREILIKFVQWLQKEERLLENKLQLG